MSRQFVSAVTLFVSVAAIAMAASHSENQAAGLRNPAMSRKEINFAEHKPSPFKHTEKIHGPASTRLELIGATPEKVGDVFVLKGFVEAEEQITELEFSWALAPGLELVNGVKQGTISLVNPDQAAEVQITLRNLTSENRQVHLIVSGRKGGVKYGTRAQYNTQIQPMLDAEKDATLRANQEAAAKEADQRKRFH